MKSVPLSKVQHGIYAECVAHQGELCYNQPYLFVLDGSLDESKLKSAVEKAVAAHPTLFTRIEVSAEGDPMQVVEQEAFTLNVEHGVMNIEEGTFNEEPLLVPFDISKERLFHIRLMKDESHYYLLPDIHHVICDAVSLQVLLSDIEAAYDGKEPEPEVMTLMEMAAAEAELRQTPAFEESKQWYAQNFDCGDTYTPLLPDLEGTDKSEAHVIRVMAINPKKAEAFCKANGLYRTTLFTAAYAYLLAKYNNEKQALFSTVYNGRTDKRMEYSIGMTVKTLPVYAKFDDDTSVLDFLKAGQEQMSGSREHDLYAFSDVLADLNLQCDSLFVWRGEQFGNSLFSGKPMQMVQLRNFTLEVPFCLMAYMADGRYELRAEYDSSKFSETMVAQFMESYEATLGGMLNQGDLREICVTTDSQAKLLDSFNETEVPYDKTQTLVSLFRHQAKELPEKTAVVYKDKKYTYAEVDEISDRIAGFLASKGLGEEDVVAILIARSEWMAIASLGVMKAGCAYQPLDSTYPKERLNFMTQDSGTKLLIADEDLCSIVDEYQGEVLLTREIKELKEFKGFKGFKGPRPESLFTMIYTSGSTGVPKGCQLEQRNMVAFCHAHVHALKVEEESRVGAYASFGFDASLLEIWPTFMVGATLYIIPEELRFDLVALNEYFEQNGITHTFMTTQVGRSFVNDIPNHSLKGFITGGEKLADVTPPPYLLLNGYGPSETICYVTAFPVKEKMQNIPIGKAVENMHLFIMDAYGHRLPVGAAGELWVNGPQVGRGYLNRPEKTAEAFVESPFGRCYRTGDIVRYLSDGNIQFVGRRDGQVKIRGFRIELTEVEAVIRQFPGIKDATVQAFDEEGGGKFIAAYIVSDEQIDIEALNNFIMDEKPPYMVPAVTMQIDAIPLNQNQKVNKKALPKPEKKAAVAEEESNVPMNVLEKEIHRMIAEIINTEDFGVTTILGYVGLTSIMAIKLAIQISKRFGVTLNSKALPKTGSVQSIENEILTAMMQGGMASVCGDESEAGAPTSAPLSYAQTGVYFDCMKNPTSTLYNTPVCMTFPVETDTEALKQAAIKAVENHPALFVQFVTGDNGVEQVMGDRNAPVEVEDFSMSEEEALAFRHGFVRPFNLSKDRLFRLATVRTDKALYLYSDIHHLVCDGYSYDLFIHEICDLLNGKDVEPEMCSYNQFVAEQKAAESSEAFAEAAEFFKQRLGEIEEVTELAPDLTNPRQQGENARVCAHIAWDDAEKLAKQQGVKPSAVLLSAVFYSLARFSGNDQVCITTISNGRSNLKVANTMGMFVNTLALASKIGNQSVKEFLRKSEETFDQTLAHENYPFARVAADYGMKADIMFAYQMGVLSDYRVGGKKVLADETMELNDPKFKIAFYITDESGEPLVALEYDNGRYSEAMMQSLAQSVSNAVSAFAAAADRPLRSIVLTDKTSENLLDSFNQTEVPYDNTQTIVSLFRRQASETPDNLAVVYHDVRLTYREVDERTDAIAAMVQSKVESDKENVVSILIGRSEWMVLASLGVLKAGCAYQPLDPSYPTERLNFMMKDANAKLLIAEEELLEKVSEYGGPVVLTKDMTKLSGTPAPVNIKPEDLFILLYTSGSTGQPKGCQLEQRNLVCFCHWYRRYYNLQPGDKVAAYASYGFDANMMDLYPALTTGATVVVVGDDIRLNLPDLNAYFNEEGVTHSFMTTQVGCQFAMNCDNHSLQHLSVGGEKLLPLEPPTAYKMYNVYGPTECTIFTTTYQLKEFEQNAPIGKPLDNLELFIIDKDHNRLPLGAVGELLVSGPQVSRGYLNLPEKTADTYIQWNGKRCYRTGDVVRYLSSGDVQFVGRSDGQVKIRGFRIELKEVESVIREFPGIKDATVQAFDYANGGKFIAAYIVSDEQVDVQALNAFIRNRKPPYMVPAATMQIPEIPLNQNQKVNKKALPAPQIQVEEHEFVAPVGEVEKLFCDIFAGIMSLDKVGATDNFFEMGGTSLMVTKVVIEADKAGHHVAYGDVFEHPTPRLLAQFVGGATPVDATDTEIENFDYKDIDALLQRNVMDTFLKGERQQLGNVLLTGATGYLGIHVLRELINSDATTITCFVRGKDQASAEHRLKNLLFYYFESSFKELFGKRLFVVNGDVTEDLSQAMPKGHPVIQTVFNCAANVKHFSKGTDIEDVNIGGAQRCVEFCLKTGARLVHISTTSVGEVWIINNEGEQVPMLDERKLWFGQFLDNRYIHSKFLAERLILDAVAKQGLSAKVMRVGNLAPRSADGEFQANFNTNSYMGRLKVFHMLGCCPYDSYDEHTEMSPIDETAKAVVLLASTPKECTMFQPFNNHTELLGDVLRLMEKVGREMRFVEDDEFEQTVATAGQDPEKAKLLSAILAYQDVAHGQKTAVIERDNRYTCSVLHRLGFHWSDTSSEYIVQMMRKIAAFGFFL